MTPKIWYRLSFTIERYEKHLVAFGILCLLSIGVMLLFMFLEIMQPTFLVIVPALLLFYCCGLGMVKKYFKTDIEKSGKTIGLYLTEASVPRKVMMYYASFFLVAWFIVITIMLYQVTNAIILK
jgi:hypothetical protein